MPVFNCDNSLFDFIKNVKLQIVPNEIDCDIYDREFLYAVCECICNILDYSQIKLDKDFLKLLSDAEKNERKLRIYRGKFEKISNSLRNFIKRFETDGHFNVNWLIKVLAYEYAPLAGMKAIACGGYSNEDIANKVNGYITLYNSAVESGKTYDSYSQILWQGYSEYNLTRAYEQLYNVGHSAECLQKMEECSIASMNTRSEWCDGFSFPGIFSTALSFEYFLVCLYELKMRYTYKEYTNDSPAEIMDDLATLKNKLKQYCENTEFTRLYDMYQSIEKLAERISSCTD